MATNSPIQQTLVTTGNLAPLAAGNPISALAPGQVGVFNYHTGLSVGAASAVTELQDIYLAVGVNRSGTSTLEDVNFSAGQLIQAPRVSDYTNRCYAAPKPMVVEIKDFTAKCEKDYGLKIEFRNQQIYRYNGYNQFTKTWTERAGCCDNDCTDCSDVGDCSQLALNLVNQINSDKDQLVLAELIDYTTTPGTSVVVPIAGYQAWVDDPANAGKCLGIRLTSIPEKINSFCDINLKYWNPRGTFLIVSLIEGFNCNGTVTTTQELGYEEGNGYDIRQLEYQAGGWNGKPGPYRVSALNGVAATGFEYLASGSVKYSQVILHYDVKSQSNFLMYENNTQTIVAIPCGDNTTRNGLIAILDKAFPQFAPNAGNSALCDCTGAAHTDELAVANNGIKTLA